MQNRPEETEGTKEREEGHEREFVVRFRLPRLPRLLPEETREHFMAAQREMLLAFRSLIDAAIEKTEPKSKPEGKGPTKIEVE